VFALSTVLAIALKTCLLVIVTGVASAVVMKKPAAYRHFLWTCALALALMMPFASLYLPSYAVIPVSWQAPERWWLEAASTGKWLPIAHAASERRELTADSVIEAAGSMLPIIWSVGVLGLLIRDALANVGLMRWVRGARPLGSKRWTATLDRLSSELGLSRPLRVLESPNVVSPCTWGFVQPVLLLPLAGNEWSESQRRHALLHELAHIRRFDYLSTLVSRLACAIHWYNPLVWFAAAQARKLQEQACDDAVLAAGGTPSEYAQFLVTVAEEASSFPAPMRMAIAMAQRSLLHGRVVAILDPHKARVQPGFVAFLAAVAPLSGLMLLLATTATTANSVTTPATPSTTRATPTTPTPPDPPDPVEALPPVDPIQPLPPLTPLDPIPPLDPVEAIPPQPPVQAVPPLDEPVPQSSAAPAV